MLAGDLSLMQATIERGLALTTANRISIVVSAPHERVARDQIRRYPGVELIVCSPASPGRPPMMT